jgi:putative Ca2+/H+ antiporter (TMEM165/GDT1 family)
VRLPIPPPGQVEKEAELYNSGYGLSIKPAFNDRRFLMELKALLTVFITIFLAELGDKTQLATLLYATDRNVSKLTVFLGASLALIAATAIGVLVGHLLSTHINTRYLHYLAGAGFIVIGFWTLMKA